MRSLPKVVSNIPNDLRAFVDRVREYIANSGDDAFVTKGDLLRGGIINTTPGGTIIPPGSTVVQNPTVPTGLAASGALATIIVTWDAPLYGGHLETRVWAASTDDFSAKVMVGSSPGTTFSHSVGGGASRYYWIQHVNVNLVEGPFNDIAGTLGITGTDPAYLLDVLDGAITETQLYADLNDRIDLIDGSAATPGTIPYQLSLLQGQIDELNATPVYDNSTTYAIGDIVQYEGGLYQATAATTGNLPTDEDYWIKIGDYSSLGDAVAAHTTEIATLTTDLGAEVATRELLAAQMRGTYTGTDLSLVTAGLIYSEREARASADSSEVTARETLAAQVRGTYTGTDVASVSAGLLFSERTARATADSALASDISTLSTTVGNQTTSLQTLFQSVDGIKGLYTVKIDNNGSVGGFGLESVLDNAGIALWAASTYYAIGAVRRVSGVTTKVMRCSVAGISGTSTPTLAGAVGTTFTDGTATWEIASSTATSTFIANVDKFAVTTPTSSIPARTNSTAYSVGSFVGVAGATDKMLVCKVAGTSASSLPTITWTIGTLVTDGTVVWQVTSRVPFSVLTSSQTINGITVPPGVYIDGASIVNATINNAQIANLAVDNAKIANMAVDKLTAGALQVGSYIQSTSYVAGSSGWRINANGSAEFSNVTVRGTVASSTISGSTILGGSAASYASGTGLFAGLDSSVYKFRVGTASGNRMYWDGSSLVVVGTLSGSTITGTSISGSTLTINTAAVSGTTMTGSGAVFNSSGTFAFGNSTTNISFNGTTMTLNGSVVGTNNVQGGTSGITDTKTFYTGIRIDFAVASTNVWYDIPLAAGGIVTLPAITNNSSTSAFAVIWVGLDATQQGSSQDVMRYRVVRQDGVTLNGAPNFKADGANRVFSFVFVDTAPLVSPTTNTYRLQAMYTSGLRTYIDSIQLVGSMFKK